MAFLRVYGPCGVVERHRLWEELSIMNDIWELPWCICGDFNEVRYMHERQGCIRSSRGMQDFDSFIDNHNLIDIPIQGARYTWISSSSVFSSSKLDRFLISVGWEDHFPSISVTAMARPMSDHKPILLCCNIDDWGPPPWRFERMWLLDNSLLSLMADWWSSFVISGPPGFQLARKFQMLKAKLRAWNRDVFGNIDRRFERILQQIKVLDSCTMKELSLVRKYLTGIVLSRTLKISLICKSCITKLNLESNGRLREKETLNFITGLPSLEEEEIRLLVCPLTVTGLKKKV